MKNYIGIDLGTTNSAICSYDGSETHIWKSPDQTDVTPSAIFIDRRGNKYFGMRAYNSAPWQPDNAVLLFKRIMGTSTPIRLPAINLTMSPEECSTEILKLLFGYLPEEIRNDADIGTVITVPAAFNLMQKDATIQAAQMAGIGKVALMQEPVAAVMSVMRVRKTDGMFLIYDFGGGTLDIAIAESTGGRVSLLAHGGIAMCGGRDFDRVFVENIVKPWLLEKYNLPDDISVNPKYKTLIRVATWATEKAKIELSAKEETIIMLNEDEMRCHDLSGTNIYLEIPILRETYNKLIEKQMVESIEAARDTLLKAGLTPQDLERIVFVGGPTNYKPLRDKVSFELGIPGSTEVNPMTAVAEGASLFAESIDWSSKNHSRKNTRGQISSRGGLPLTFKFNARSSDLKAKIIVQLTGQVAVGFEFQIDSIDTGWMSGRLPLKNGSIVDVTLSKYGKNIFKVWVFDSVGAPIVLGQDQIIITRTTATVDAIPASHSISLEILEKMGGQPILDFLVKAGDSLPIEGKNIYKAAESLKAGSIGSLNFKLWEGEIDNPISDNRPIGVLKISGSDFDSGVIPAGADLVCEYKILDSGNIILEVSVPCIGGTFSPGKNFYSRQEGQIDLTSASTLIIEKGKRTLNRIDEINEVVDDLKLEQARQKLESVKSLDPQDADPEKVKKADDNIHEAHNLLSQINKEHLKEIRQIDLDMVISFFNEQIRKLARPSEATTFDNLAKTAQRSITNRNSRDFEHHLDELRQKTFGILWRQDWFVVERFKSMINSPHLFTDKKRFEELLKIGMQHMRSDDIEKLRAIVIELYKIQIGDNPENEMGDIANIIRG